MELCGSKEKAPYIKASAEVVFGLAVVSTDFFINVSCSCQIAGNTLMRMLRWASMPLSSLEGFSASIYADANFLGGFSNLDIRFR